MPALLDRRPGLAVVHRMGVERRRIPGYRPCRRHGHARTERPVSSFHQAAGAHRRLALKIRNTVAITSGSWLGLHSTDDPNGEGPDAHIATGRSRGVHGAPGLGFVLI